MDLFTSNRLQNIIPFEGEVLNYGLILNNDECQYYLKKLLNADFWKYDELILFGKQIRTKRKVAWFGDKNIEYSYSNTKKIGLAWTSEILKLKQLVELKAGENFNSCLLNLYHNGDEGMSWHSDNEKELGVNPTIASLSFGATRKFSLKHKVTKQKVDVQLQSGNLLVMKGETQHKWIHSLPKTKKVKTPRINLTFRNIIK
ncbi:MULTISPECIES: alpha-ketoglutarate-dependent dioxygenase AlkB family protein [Flavobacteriaceae]|uniref:Alpha-ketoglutarate-dependent dioxygenase AlkB n=2 Tax=Flavobacteriaceae TaxID=49546 RepID=A0A4Y8ASH1_9FLAO|nr:MULTISPECIES: alpha-ketoglutarate-dependent dioxygenase AlkB [Flavobacteriaceae]TEW74841.1 alpha-ketoglutarate-dependent dioxygenase AlkB [Gramella jeungdoensis]GGK43579.1 DNA methylase [Lutibacter litoralis]